MKSPLFSLIRLVSRRLIPVLVLSLALLATACKSDLPEGVLDEQTMTDVLYDYHLAQALGESADAQKNTDVADSRYNKQYYMKAALAKHGLTEADFDRSLEWYTRHSDRLFDIYKRLDERVAAEVGAGAATGRGSLVGAASADTTDIWQGSRACLLSSSGQNVLNFEQPVDTALRAGDRLTLHFNTTWIYREGTKDAYMQLALVYDNDSVDVVSSSVRREGEQELSITVGKRPLKAVRGFVYQQAPWSERPKLLVLTDVALVRMRRSAEPLQVSEPLAADSLRPVAPATLRRPADDRRVLDSLRRTDSINEARPHFR